MQKKMTQAIELILMARGARSLGLHAHYGVRIEFCD